MKILLRNENIRNAYERWKKQYECQSNVFRFWDGTTVKEDQKRWDSLDVKHCSFDAIDAIGYASWLTSCVECGNPADILILFATYYEGDSSIAVCRACLNRAKRLVHKSLKDPKRDPILYRKFKL